MKTLAKKPLFDDLPRQRDPVLYIVHEIEGDTIEQRRDDGYIDATAMCRAYGKFWGTIWQNDETKAIAAAIERKLNIGIPIIRTEAGRHGGTWVHPQFAVYLATRLNPDFAATVFGWVLDWMQGRQPAFHKDEIEPFVLGRLVQETHTMVSRILDNTAHTDQNTTNTAVDVKEMRVDLWRVIGEDLPKQPKQPAPPRGPSRGSWGQPIPKLAEPRR